MTKRIQNMLASRHFFVDLAGKRNRWHRQKNGLPQGNILSSFLFNIYINEQPIHPNTKRFVSADGLYIASQEQSFEKVEQSLTDALDGLTNYYAVNHLQSNPGKTQINVFNLKNIDANIER